MPNLKFGWHMPSFPMDGSDGATFIEHIHGFITHIEPNFDSVWVDDHMFPGFPGISNDTTYLECLTTIAHLATAHPNVTFGASVLCQSYRNPALLARTVANLHLLTGGRFLFGIGAGWMEEEYKAYNFDFPKASARIDQMEETIQIVRRMWTEAPASFAGKYYRIENAWCGQRPSPVPKILIGGGGEQKTLRVVARHADWWNLNGGSVENYAHKLDVLRQYCDEIGRDFDEIVKTWSVEGIALGETEAEAQRVAAETRWKKDVRVGTPAQIAEQLQPFVDLGVEYLIVRLVDFPSHAGMDLFTQEVIPRLRATQRS
jgi:alkanesulfonate monooxygenase SsuD/methylene tetrahydromethanopterin reductase-like flavin-dependent oxidoreductase (luciferase family)